MKLSRAASIASVLLEEGLGFLTHRTDDEALPVPEAEAARRLRHTLERLGPTFVKFGQLLATRVDLFGPAILTELEQLHAAVEPFPTAQARDRVEEELGRPIAEVFATFADAPVAAASIAQVYRARLKDGREVAVKVQRPGIDLTLQADLDTLLTLSGFIDRLVPPYRRTMVHQVAKEYASRARSELDFLAEAAAIERFADVLATTPGFRVPSLERSLCSGRVLVMEWLDGTRLGDVPDAGALAALGFEPEDFCRSMLALQLSMAYEHGFVHGDTHPGNLILLPDGTIGLIDFGLHGQVPRRIREKMLEMLFCQASGRTDDAVNAFAQVFQPDPTSDMDAFRRELAVVLAEGGVSSTLAESRYTEQLVRGMQVGAKYRLQARSELFMVLRNLTIVEGIVLRYCPSMDPAAEVKELTGAILRRKLFGPTMQEDLARVVPQLMLTLTQRPRFAEKLLAMERRFVDAPDLGVFLRGEGVIQPAPAPHPAGYAVVALLGVLVGLAIAAVL